MAIKRIPLKNNDIIILFKENPDEILKNKDKALKEKVYFKIKKFIGEGGSSLVYEVEKEDGTIGRLKEFYPINYDVKRIENNFRHNAKLFKCNVYFLFAKNLNYYKSNNGYYTCFYFKHI